MREHIDHSIFTVTVVLDKYSRIGDRERGSVSPVELLDYVISSRPTDMVLLSRAFQLEQSGRGQTVTQTVPPPIVDHSTRTAGEKAVDYNYFC